MAIALSGGENKKLVKLKIVLGQKGGIILFGCFSAEMTGVLLKIEAIINTT